MTQGIVSLNYAVGVVKKKPKKNSNLFLSACYLDPVSFKDFTEKRNAEIENVSVGYLGKEV